MFVHKNSDPSARDRYIDFQLFMTDDGRQLLFSLKLGRAKLRILPFGTKFDCPIVEEPRISRGSTVSKKITEFQHQHLLLSALLLYHQLLL